MTKIPTYPVPTQKTDPLPNVWYDPTVPSGAFGQRFAQTVQDVGHLLGRRTIEMRNENEYNAASMAFYSTKDAVTAYMTGSAANPGPLTMHGGAAMGVTEASMPKVDEISKGFSSSLSDFATPIYNKMYNEYRGQVFGSLSRHEANERPVYQNEVVGRAKEQALQDVGRNPFDDQVEETALRELTITSALNGKSQLEIEDMRREIKAWRDQNLTTSMIRTDPITVLNELEDSLTQDGKPGTGKYSDMSTEWIEARMSEASTQYEGYQRNARMAEERIRKEEERVKKELTHSIVNDGIDLQRDNRLTEAWLVANEPFIPNDKYKMFSDWLINGPPNKENTNPLVYHTLSKLVKSGLNPNEEIFTALQNGTITIGDRDRLLAASTKARFTGPKEYLHALVDVSEDSAAGARMAMAEMEYDNWVIDNPDATRPEAVAKADALAKRALLYDIEGMSIFHLQPEFMVGTLGEDDVDWGKTSEDTFLHYGEKHHGNRDAMEADPDYQRELKRIRSYKITHDLLLEMKRMYPEGN